MNKEPRQIEVVVDFVDRVHGTGFPEIRLWRPLSAFPVEFVDVVRGTDGWVTVAEISSKDNWRRRVFSPLTPSSVLQKWAEIEC